MQSTSTRSIVFLALIGTACGASARSSAPWDGGYIGFDLGDASRSSCYDWSLTATKIGFSNPGQFNDAGCSSGGSFVGGLKLGDNFQYKRFVWGVEADLDYWKAGTVRAAVTQSGDVPAGKYTFTSRQNPDAFLLVGPRIGYGGDTWLPYVTVGGLLPIGPSTNELFYTALGAKTASASFGAAKTFSSAGWAAGGGFELGLNSAWSISAEYLRANLGHGSETTTACAGVPAACAAFAAISLDSTRGALKSNIFRIGVVYYFDYWNI
jgi:opacity protein-like surface antigen